MVFVTVQILVGIIAVVFITCDTGFNNLLENVYSRPQNGDFGAAHPQYEEQYQRDPQQAVPCINSQCF